MPTPVSPPPQKGAPLRVLVTGATGYVGSRVVPTLLAEGHEVVAATRGGDIDAFAWSDQVSVATFDMEDTDSVLAATTGVDAVVYLVHAMDSEDFVAKDREAADRMAYACETNGVSRIVYLSGIVPDEELSDHLRSRLEVEETLTGSRTPTVALRAAMVIGSGSTSFELMRRMSERVPFTPIPTWMRRMLQPIAVEDVVALIAAALRGEPRNRSYDVGGPDVLSYADLLAVFARTAGLRRLQVPVPFLPTSLVGFVVSQVAQMPRTTVMALVESLSHDMVCQEHEVVEDLLEGEHRFVPVAEAIKRSLSARSDGTSTGGDVQVGAPTDPDWAGGAVTVEGGRPRQRPGGIVAALLLGAASSHADRQRRKS